MMRVLALLAAVALVATIAGHAVRRARRAHAELKRRERSWWNAQVLTPLADGVRDEEQVS